MSSLLFSQFSSFTFHILIHVSLIAVFHHNIDIIVIFKGGQVADNIFIPTIEEDSNLIIDQLLKFGYLFDSVLLNYFAGCLSFVEYVYYQIDRTKVPRSQ